MKNEWIFYLYIKLCFKETKLTLAPIAKMSFFVCYINITLHLFDSYFTGTGSCETVHGNENLIYSKVESVEVSYCILWLCVPMITNIIKICKNTNLHWVVSGVIESKKIVWALGWLGKTSSTFFPVFPWEIDKNWYKRVKLGKTCKNPVWWSKFGNLTSESHLWSRLVKSLATSGTTGCASMCTTNEIQQKLLHTLKTMRTSIQIKHTRKKRHL